MSRPPESDRRARLHALLREQIQAHGGRLPFRDYMDAALYAPGLGYYASGAVSLGQRGDFVTSPEVDPAFGRLLARWLVRVDADLGHPARFDAVEMGAGTGRLAADILGALHDEQPDLFRRICYTIVERSEGLRAQQQELLAWVPGASITWAAGLDALAPGSITGAIFSNELVDAFPIHRVVIATGVLQEVYVTLDTDGNFREELGPPSTPALAAHFAWLGAALPPGGQGEVNLEAMAWMDQVARVLARGHLLTIDYGDSAERLYSDLRPEGTFLCYTQGQVTDNAFAAPGAQDMTAHVDFTALQKAGEAAGLATLALTRQMQFLVELGMGELIAGLHEQYNAQVDTLGRQAAAEAQLATRARLFRLIDPDTLGRFHVLIQAKGMRHAA